MATHTSASLSILYTGVTFIGVAIVIYFPLRDRCSRLYFPANYRGKLENCNTILSRRINIIGDFNSVFVIGA